MNPTLPESLIADLQHHLEICRRLLVVVERENQGLRQAALGPGAEFQQKKNLLPSLDQSLNRIRQHRVEWCKRSPRERAAESKVAALLRETQDLIMKIIVLDRENEQILLRKGLVPARHLPHANRQRPHYVADLYRRQNDAGVLRPGQAAPE
jgi:hypothetical protein